MPDAWSYYLFPLTIAISFIFGGWWSFRRFARGDRNSKGRKYGSTTGCGGILFMAVGTTLCLAVLLTSPTPWQRTRLFNHIFRTPPERIARLVIKAGGPDRYRPLTASDVIIDNPARIQQIAQVLLAATETSPSHPRSRWTARVEMITKDGVHHFTVSAPEAGDSNGTLITVLSKPEGAAWHLTDVRADGLETILESAVNAARSH